MNLCLSSLLIGHTNTGSVQIQLLIGVPWVSLTTGTFDSTHFYQSSCSTSYEVANFLTNFTLMLCHWTSKAFSMEGVTAFMASVCALQTKCFLFLWLSCIFIMLGVVLPKLSFSSVSWTYLGVTLCTDVTTDWLELLVGHLFYAFCCGLGTFKLPCQQGDCVCWKLLSFNMPFIQGFGNKGFIILEKQNISLCKTWLSLEGTWLGLPVSVQHCTTHLHYVPLVWSLYTSQTWPSLCWLAVCKILQTSSIWLLMLTLQMEYFRTHIDQDQSHHSKLTPFYLFLALVASQAHSLIYSHILVATWEICYATHHWLSNPFVVPLYRAYTCLACPAHLQMVWG